ncbi:E3 ubiquitin-protein ligase RNF19A [Lates japonicus]|uniref:E3 ubiquitin-protein ligase RNF19A n=1 Tax=Lates japonicus TaxID=270547 RepID=A0AAD3M6N5_LATJO|nr:E3 ubiquitin-protein ligase RNF19A [Lates japonicus]
MILGDPGTYGKSEVHAEEVSWWQTLTAAGASTPDCGVWYAVIAFGCASCPKITCGREGCGTQLCYHSIAKRVELQLMISSHVHAVLLTSSR